MKNHASEQSPKYKWYVLALLTGVYTFAYIDRQLIVIMQESIKKEIGLSDTELGLISGLAFALFYATAGLFIARLSDKYNRKNIIAGSLFLWSLITALTGLANSFLQLLLARIGVGIGETGGIPPSHSIIAEYFPPKERGNAYAIHSTGIYLGLLFGFLMGGILEAAWGWRAAFFIVGIPGILFSLLLYFTLKEPKRGVFDTAKPHKEQLPTIKDVLIYLKSKKTFLYLSVGGSLHAFVGTSFANWMPPFLARVHQMETIEIAIWLAFAIGVCGGIGTYLGGYLGDKLAPIDQRWYLWLPAIAICLSFPFAIGLLFSEDKTTALSFYLIPNILYAIFMGPSYAVLQNMVGSNMRAISSAIFIMILNLVGMGLGPLSVGMISDWLTPQYGADAIRWALFSVAFLELIAVFCFLKATTYLIGDMVTSSAK